MKVLAIDSSGLVATVGIVTEEVVLAEYTVNFKKTHSQTLLPMMNEIVEMVDFDLKDADGIAITSGPGSFTGLRIGAATAKGLGLALNKPIIPVPTLEGLAYNLCGTNQLVCPMMDARRNQVYTALYDFVGQDINIIENQKAVPVEEMMDQINDLGREVIFLGDGSSAYSEIIHKNTKVKFSFAPLHLNRHRAGSVGALGIQYYKENKFVTASEFAPIYLRLSQAERERAERELGNRN
ncbi:MAG TPA: tRNA (adenosine(37)-N6)-threonylcarbamoyltransferase complex dimerization subunit type 1 TsaB [Clostridiales bacterium]|nr:tRNA (adenosine(37)-N6)-threonylcarbamoyltransferase complex dimerization subunit type 1 TsaB [Clostridiales bacterium]